MPCLRRLQLLSEAGARSLIVFAAAPQPALALAAGKRLRRHWPSAEEIEAAQFVFIADVPEPERSALAAAARRAGAILHVEDAPQLGDSHAPAVLRRGALTIAVSTEGAAPAAAVEIKRFLATVIGPEWRRQIEHLRTLREGWRRAGCDHDTVRRLTASQIGQYGWLEVQGPAYAANDRGARLQQTEKGVSS